MKMRNWLGFILVVLLISAALFLQWFEHLKPCPLCIMQRIAFIAIAFLFLAFALLPSRIWLVRLQGLLLIAASGSGFAIAARQVYLQHLPPGQAPSCGPGLGYLFDALPWHEALAMILQGSGECAVVDWRFLGLSMAAWSALWLLFFFGYGLLMISKKTL
jgi:disulfide bond formation protein DsbB